MLAGRRHANHRRAELALTEGLRVGRAVATRQRAVLLALTEGLWVRLTEGLWVGLTEGLWVGWAVATRQRAVLQHPQRVVVVTLAVTRPLVTLRVVLVHVHARVYRET